VAVDGAIIRAQFDHSPQPALHALDRLVRAVLAN
jgi:hypothetical protein